MSGLFNWAINLLPVLGTVAEWFKKVLNVKMIAFLLMKGIIFFIFYKYLPFLFGKFYQWIYDLGSTSDSGFDLSFLSVLTNPQLTGFPAWLFSTLKLGTVLRIMISGAMVRLGIKRLPFMPG
jgi:hypothetical protein